MSSNPVLIGIAGGSCSGKTTFAKWLYERIGSDNCELLWQDNYYIDQSHHFDHDGGSVNFDHPDAIDFELMLEHLSELKIMTKFLVLLMTLLPIQEHQQLLM